MRCRLRWMTLVLMIALLALTDPAAAQSQTDVTGAADFRNPPILENGSYGDEIVTGETVWYGVIYRNDTPFRFEAAVTGTGDGSDLDLIVSMVSPTLAEVESGSGVLESSGVAVRGAATDLWYVTVELRSSGQLGVPHRLILDIDGVEETSLLPCSRVPGCTLDDELAAIDARIAELQPQLDATLELPSTDLAEREIESLESFVAAGTREQAAIEARLVVGEAQLADLCAPQATCTTFPDPGGKTPKWALLLGLGVLGWGAYRIVNKVREPRQKKPKQAKPVSYTPRGMRSAGT